MRLAQAILVAMVLSLLVLSVPLPLQTAPYSLMADGPEGLGFRFETRRDGPRLGDADVVVHSGPLRGLDPARDALLVVAPRLGYSAEEGAALRSFLAAGGRALVADDTGSARGLLGHASLGVEISVSGVFSTSFDPDPTRPLATGAGLEGLPSPLALTRPHAVVGSGEALLWAHELSWLDVDNDLAPDLDEPRGAWAFARRTAFGSGEIVVLGDPDLLRARDGLAREAGDAFLGWLADGRRVVVDEGHRARTDPLGVAPLLAGAHPERAWLLVAVAGAVATLAAFRPRLRRIRPGRARPPLRRDPVRQAVLAELAP